MLSGENDRNNCFMDINAGAGGTESHGLGRDADAHVHPLLRAAAAGRWRSPTWSPGEEAGFKNVSLRIEGEFAYGYLKAEVGVHRLVRISPFDANARRQTAFASVDVYPEVDDDIEDRHPGEGLRAEVHPRRRRRRPEGEQDLVDGAAAPPAHRHPDHLPDRALAAANRDMAFKILRGRLYELGDEEARGRARDAAEAQKKDIAFGSQIRSYVLAPYRMVKDLRTGVETGNVDAVLDGELDEFITAQLLGVKNPNRSASAD